MDAKIFFLNKNVFAHKKLKKLPKKSCILMAVERFFFSAQNSPELHFCFINSFIQSSLLRSLVKTVLLKAKSTKKLFIITYFWSKCFKIKCWSKVFYLSRAFHQSILKDLSIQKIHKKMFIGPVCLEHSIS